VLLRSQNVRTQVEELPGPDRAARGEGGGDEEGVHQAPREVRGILIENTDDIQISYK
jgi:hypothetical protein